MSKYFLAALVSLLSALVVTPYVAALALRIGAVDEPGDRRVHVGRVPRLGGLAVLVALLAGFAALEIEEWLGLLQLPEGTLDWGLLTLGALLAAAIGAADDVWQLRPGRKLVGQIVAGLVAIASGCMVRAVSNPFTGSTIDLGLLSGPLTLLWVLGITNALNLIDGLDGLAAGVALIATCTLGVLLLNGDQLHEALVATAMVGALGGFLYYNFNPAKIFLGDSGSYLLGYLLAVLSVRAGHKGATVAVVLTPILALGLPIMDTALAILRRSLGALGVVRVDVERNQYRFVVLGSASIFRADRNHIHHRLLQMGVTHRRAVLLLYTACLVLAGLAMLSLVTGGQPGDVGLLVLIVTLLMYAVIRQFGYRELQLLKRGALLPLFDLPGLNRRAFHVLVDAGAIAGAYVAAVFLARNGVIDAEARQHLLWSVATLVAVKIGVFLWDGVYRRSFRYTNISDSLVLYRCLIAAESLSVGVVLILHGPPENATVVFVLDFFLSQTLVMWSRMSFTILEILAGDRTGETRRRALIYSAGFSGTTLLREIQHNPTLPYKVIGFIDDYPPTHGRLVNGVEVLGGCADLERLITENRVQKLILASHKISTERVNRAKKVCARLGVAVRRFNMTLDEVEMPNAIDAVTEGAAGVEQTMAGV